MSDGDEEISNLRQRWLLQKERPARRRQVMTLFVVRLPDCRLAIWTGASRRALPVCRAPSRPGETGRRPHPEEGP